MSASLMRRTLPETFRSGAWRLAWPSPTGWAFATGYGLLVTVPWFVAMLDFGAIAYAPRAILVQVLEPQIAAILVLLGWTFADTGGARDSRRRVRIAVAVTVALVIEVVLAPWLLQSVLGLPDIIESALNHKGEAVPPRWIMAIVYFLSNALFAAFAIVLVEVWRARRIAISDLRDAAAEGAAIRRRLLEARLAAMQAQVEPQFLFDALVEIEGTYVHDRARASEQMDRLIVFLRMALPGLRGNGAGGGSTLGAELALIEAYLAIVRARHDGMPVLDVATAVACRSAPCYPMLLLPLVQRALHGDGRMARTLRIEAACDESQGGLRVRLSGDILPHMAKETEIEQVRGRIDGLYDGRARLRLVADQTGTSIELVLPDAERGTVL